MNTQEQTKELVFHLIQKGDASGLAMFLKLTGHKVGTPELCAAVQRASQFGIDGEAGVGRMRVMRLVLEEMPFDVVGREVVGRLIKGVEGTVARLDDGVGWDVLERMHSSLETVKSPLRFALQ
jgi:hypothetical protein